MRRVRGQDAGAAWRTVTVTVTDLLRAAVFHDALQQPVADALRLLGPLPQNVLQQQRVVFVHSASTARVRSHAQHGDSLDQAPVCVAVAGRKGRQPQAAELLTRNCIMLHAPDT